VRSYGERKETTMNEDATGTALDEAAQGAIVHLNFSGAPPRR